VKYRLCEIASDDRLLAVIDKRNGNNGLVSRVHVNHGHRGRRKRDSHELYINH